MSSARCHCWVQQLTTTGRSRREVPIELVPMVSSEIRDQDLHVDICHLCKQRVKRVHPSGVALLGDVGIGVQPFELNWNIASKGWKLSRHAK